MSLRRLLGNRKGSSASQSWKLTQRGHSYIHRFNGKSSFAEGALPIRHRVLQQTLPNTSQLDCRPSETQADLPYWMGGELKPPRLIN